MKKITIQIIWVISKISPNYGQKIIIFLVLHFYESPVYNGWESKGGSTARVTDGHIQDTHKNLVSCVGFQIIVERQKVV